MTPDTTNNLRCDTRQSSVMFYSSMHQQLSTQLKFPAVVPCMFLKLLLWSGYVVPHTDPQASVWLYHVAILRFMLTAKNVNNTSLLSVSFRRICLFFFCFFFPEWETEKGKMLGNITFCLNIHWCWWNRNCKYKYKHA